MGQVVTLTTVVMQVATGRKSQLLGIVALAGQLLVGIYILPIIFRKLFKTCMELKRSFRKSMLRRRRGCKSNNEGDEEDEVDDELDDAEGYGGEEIDMM